MSPVLPREERDAIRALRQKYDRVLDGRATPETAEIALELADAMVEKVPALLDALDAAEEEGERLRAALTNARAVASDRLDDIERTCRVVMAERDAARAEVAALREQYRDLATYRTTHTNLGLCPEGPDDPARDPDCPVCAALGAAPSETEDVPTCPTPTTRQPDVRELAAGEREDDR